jgi:hypothetical protein
LYSPQGGPGVSPGESRTPVTHAPIQQAPIYICNSAGENVVIADALMCTSSLTCLCDVQVNAWVGLRLKFDPRKKGPRDPFWPYRALRQRKQMVKAEVKVKVKVKVNIGSLSGCPGVRVSGCPGVRVSGKVYKPLT